MNWEWISQPFVMEAADIVHDFDQILCFMGGNVGDLCDFGAEVEPLLAEAIAPKSISSPHPPLSISQKACGTARTFSRQ
jgi:hypothetical protein